MPANFPLPRTRLSNRVNPSSYYKEPLIPRRIYQRPRLLLFSKQACRLFSSRTTSRTPSTPPPRTMAPIERITLFNIPDEAARDRVLEQYKILAKTAVKDGKPYILAAAAGPSFPDPRNKGFNLSVKTTFASLEDMKYYDTECEAHKALKAIAGPAKQDVLTTFFESVL
ncbi:Dabb family protein [Aspergillus puulaauensis]|uniref:Stress-response A/B barrel domain-containing protein n=1 Tax=Aspergillus puulaauensis TaxID=1220207 RepID=A0A7R7XFV0_9EURO|nr:uncharacterized protein APUU_21077A [Aspergillus puulaauensis]BCS20645.1 hypothetical protein APUU_21077A [Aspergillus puulaauensis]